MRVIVTGGNSGVGQATAAALAERGHSVVIACRSVAGGSRYAGRGRVTGLRKKARDPAVARRLWELSSELTGCDWRRK